MDVDETIELNPKPAQTELPPADANLMVELREALQVNDIATISQLTSTFPREMFCWASMAAVADTSLNAYAYARLGYHRGLDALRANGWRGSGYVRASVYTNRGFLTCLALLHHFAGVIGEIDEEQRCLEFLQQLDPEYDWDDFPYENPIEFLFA
jgi:hypothetical protein